MKVLVAIRVREGLPTTTGEYLTNMGKVHYDHATKTFYNECCGIPLPPYVVGTWYKELEVPPLSNEYHRGYLDGLAAQNCVHAITPLG